MDYGQGSQFTGSSKQPFFTAGAGNVYPNQNYFESENNLDLTNSSSWNQPRDYREIGNRVFMSPEGVAEQEGATDHSEHHGEQSQSIQAAEMLIDSNPNHGVASPTSPNLPPLHPSETAPTPSYDARSIRSDGDRISGSTITEIKQAMSKLSQTDDIADFYSTIRGGDSTSGMLQDYLKNSYNREVA